MPGTGSQPHNSSLAALGIGLGQAAPVVAASNGSTSSLSTAGSPSAPHTPNTPASTVSLGSTGAIMNLPPLKDTKFYKRALVEDIEPTLRLDLAPGLSWLNRRNVLAAITDGSLVVEPIPSSTLVSRFKQKPQFDPCSLCGEPRRDEEHLRTYRFRTSESGSASQYPLCKYCLGRLRSTCDYISFLRIIKDGHWHAEDEDSEKAAWEESVRLREQMFWSRIGGGVVPATMTGNLMNRATAPTTPVTPAHPADADPETVTTQEQAVTNESVVREHDEGQTPAPDTDREDFATPMGDRVELSLKTEQIAETSESTPAENPGYLTEVGEEMALSEVQERKPPLQITTPARPEPDRLSITIPGSFDSNV